jgi:hypothetical protein
MKSEVPLAGYFTLKAADASWPGCGCLFCLLRRLQMEKADGLCPFQGPQKHFQKQFHASLLCVQPSGLP